METSIPLGVMDGPLLILPLLSVLVSAGVMIVMAIAVWRIMQAQEQTARALQQIADTFRMRSD